MKKMDYITKTNKMGRIERLKKEAKKKQKICNKLSVKKLTKREEFFEVFNWMNKIVNQNK
jgi:hypothetical protein